MTDTKDLIETQPSAEAIEDRMREASIDLLREFVDELKMVIAEGCQVVPMKDGSEERIGYEAMDADSKRLFLGMCVDFTAYVNRGMDPTTSDRIIANALAGKPSDRWLEGVVANEGLRVVTED